MTNPWDKFEEWKASGQFCADLRKHAEPYIRDAYEGHDEPVSGYVFRDGSHMEYCRRPAGYLVVISNFDRFFEEGDERDSRPFDDACEFLFEHHAIDNVAD